MAFACEYEKSQTPGRTGVSCRRSDWIPCPTACQRYSQEVLTSTMATRAHVVILPPAGSRTTCPACGNRNAGLGFSPRTGGRPHRCRPARAPGSGQGSGEVRHRTSRQSWIRQAPALRRHDVAGGCGLGGPLATRTHLIAPRSFRKKPPPGRAAHRAVLADHEVKQCDGLRVTSPPPTLLDVAKQETSPKNN